MGWDRNGRGRAGGVQRRLLSCFPVKDVLREEERAAAAATTARQRGSEERGAQAEAGGGREEEEEEEPERVRGRGVRESEEGREGREGASGVRPAATLAPCSLSLPAPPKA
eukprot:3824822-Rhodomonas_salina.1